MPQASIAGKTSIDTMQNIPISRDFFQAQDAIPQKINGMLHTQGGNFQRKSRNSRINDPMINAGWANINTAIISSPQVSYPNGDHSKPDQYHPRAKNKPNSSKISEMDMAIRYSIFLFNFFPPVRPSFYQAGYDECRPAQGIQQWRNYDRTGD